MNRDVSTVLISWIAVAVSLVGFGLWIAAANPSAAAVEAARTELSPLPSPNLASLDQETFTSRQVYGVVPIDVPDGSVGRQDPFAKP